MIITAPNLNRFFTALDTRYNMQYNSTAVYWEAFAQRFPCSTEAWMQAWVTFTEKMRVWKGSRVVTTPAPLTYIAAILPWEKTIEIDRFKLEDDTYGIYSTQAAQIGETTKRWPDYTLRDFLQGAGDFTGAAQISLDGVTHWNTAHPVDYYDAGKGTYCNDFGTAGVSVDGVTVGGTFSTAAYKTVLENMRTRKNESGEPDGEEPTLLMVPPQLETEAKVLTQSAFYSPATIGVLTSQVGAVSNPFLNSTDMLRNNYLSNQPTAWYMFAANGVIKPLAWVVRKDPITIPRSRPDDPVSFDRHALQWGVEARAVPAWGPPRKATRSGIVA